MSESPTASRSLAEWVAEAEDAVLHAKALLESANAEVGDRERGLMELREIAANRRAYRRGASYVPYPSAGYDL